ncbi:SIMPL domain-containing protein [Cohnella soli]|uniref:SIMPL domain-containing protein n=1 Tax=Cohnella soli TaxID=425005 RepID=A0ABW0HN18_9BACL
MKGRVWLQGAVAAAMVLTVAWIGFGRGVGNVASAETAAASGATPYTITVGASGSIKANPDIAYVNVAVETRGAKATDAQQANAAKFAGVEKVLYEKYGIDKKDVQTTGFDVQPEYNYTEKDGQVLKGYVAVHSIQVSYRKLTEIGNLLDALTTAGANRVNGVQFSTEKREQYELDALKKAMDNAAAKAGVLATSSKRQLKGVINVVQSDSGTSPIPYPGAMFDSMAKMSAAPAATSVQTGQIEISAQVTVQYEMQ